MSITDIVEDINTLTTKYGDKVIVHYNIDTREYDYGMVMHEPAVSPGFGVEGLVYIGLYDSTVTVDKLTADTRKAVNLYHGLIYA